ALPAALGLVFAVLILAPLAPRGEISFLLDRNKVAVTAERLRVEHATYRGEDNKGHPFSLVADSAVQRSAAVPVVQMNDLTAQIQLPDGPAQLQAQNGEYDIPTEVVRVPGPVGVSIDMRDRRVVGSGGIDGVVPAGSFSSDQILADLAARTVVLNGHARLHMIPSKLSLMQQKREEMRH
ncbi:MAG: LPS export ABC transporter periplasmic protein LptC, partial [Novosphingobium sp.]|nr:LPS export ABC transporter periplasmic protein LptC [Novosphingobium sp.]